jgi:hypothetical protein
MDTARAFLGSRNDRAPGAPAPSLMELNPKLISPSGCDLGLGEPELGYVSIAELSTARVPLGLPLECDLHFAPTLTISVYAERAREHRLQALAQLGSARPGCDLQPVRPLRCTLGVATRPRAMVGWDGRRRRHHGEQEHEARVPGHAARRDRVGRHASRFARCT